MIGKPSSAAFIVRRSASTIRDPCWNSCGLTSPLQRHSVVLFGENDATLSLEAALNPNADPVVFEPILDVSALGTFLIITIVFGLLIIRTSRVEQAVEERNMALEDLRNAKSKALVVDDGEDAVQKALKRFEEALEKEESLRSIVPGVVRIVPPSAGNEQEEQARVAAKQMLGKDTFLGASKKSEGGGRLPTAALAILAVIGVSMVGLLVFLSLDPMTSNSLLNTVGGSDGNFL